MIKMRVDYLGYVIYVDAVLGVDKKFCAGAQVAGPTGFIGFTDLGIFATDTEAIECTTRWVKKWIDSGVADKALAEAFSKLSF
ncbi:hypothetical protein [Massilia aquatica]|uniref:Uncharacterized protein n=1 Tax=Massilia aquatica TaxID=2609000 RepID=A0ABX0M947_9BURK|nr:hypothetical protein [Massilia aquatica]NHZ40129.1 hypothetical protein [Massilia aquatica]